MAKHRKITTRKTGPIAEANARIREVDLVPQRQPAAMPIRMLLWCPECGHRHIDVGEFATKVHHAHACQLCGHVWRPAIEPTVGVRYLPGFKDDVSCGD